MTGTGYPRNVLTICCLIIISLVFVKIHLPAACFEKKKNYLNLCEYGFCWAGFRIYFRWLEEICLWDFVYSKNKPVVGDCMDRQTVDEWSVHWKCLRGRSAPDRHSSLNDLTIMPGLQRIRIMLIINFRCKWG